MKKALFILIIIFSSLASYGQGWEWMKGSCDTGSENGISIGQHVTTDKFSSVYLTGMAWGNGHIGNYSFSAGGVGDIPLIKFDSSGNVVWALFSGTRAEPRGIKADVFGNIYLFGGYLDPFQFIGSDTVFNPHPDSIQAFLAKVDVNGSVVWMKNIGNMKGCSGGRAQGNCLDIDRCGNVYITTDFPESFTIDNHSFTGSGPSNIFVGKFDTAGSIVWGSAFDATGYVTGISVNSSGEVYFAGGFKSDSTVFDSVVLYDPVLPQNFWRTYVAKLDTLGNVVWARSNAGEVSCYAMGLVSDTSDNVYISGTYHVGNFPPDTVTFGLVDLPVVPSAQVYGFLTKYDVNGIELWGKCSRAQWVVNKFVTVDNCNNVWLLGGDIMAQQDLAIVDTIDGHVLTAPPHNVSPCFLAGWDESGNYLDGTILSAGMNNDAGGIVADDFGNVYIGGVSLIDTFYLGNDSLYNPNGHTGFGGNPYNMFVAKYNTGFNCTYTPPAPCWPASINTTTSNERLLTIYPNPTHENLTIETTISKYTLTIFNTLGQQLYSKANCSGKEIVNTQNLAPGVYHLRVEGEDGEVVYRKVVVEH